MDGYVLIEINTNGQMRVQETGEVRQLHFFDFRLEVLDLENDFIVDCVEPSLPKGINDVLVMVFFTYKSVPSGSGDYWSVDYEDCVIPQSHTVVKTDYKEFYRKMVTEELNEKSEFMYDKRDNEAEDYYTHLVAEWEEFYDEVFEPSKPKKLKFL